MNTTRMEDWIMPGAFALGAGALCAKPARRRGIHLG
jgi:hypothetical protein